MKLEKELIKILSKRFQGEKLSLRQLSKEFNLDFDTLLLPLNNLQKQKIVSLNPIFEIGRVGPVDVKITNFVSPKKESILRHPLFIAMSVLLIGWIGTLIKEQWIVPKIKENKENSVKQTIALSIYSEVLGNVKKIELCLVEIEAGKIIDSDKFRFSGELYRKHFTPGIFGGGTLEQQITNFYNGIFSLSPLYKKIDYERLKQQGDEVLQLLKDKYGFQDFDQLSLSNEKTGMITVSADSGHPDYNNSYSDIQFKAPLIQPSRPTAPSAALPVSLLPIPSVPANVTSQNKDNKEK